jgi:predicted permease
MLELFRYDVKHALRGLLRDRAFSAVAVLSIGLGVGANSAIFSLVDQALMRRLPVREPERLVLVNWNGSQVSSLMGSWNLLSHPFFRDLKADNQVFEGVFARHPTNALFSIDGKPEAVNTEIVSGSYFPVLGVKPALGRLLDESDDVTPGAHPVVALSYDYWKNRLGGRSDAVGMKVLLNNHPMTVVGVSAPGFRGVDFGELPAVFVPIMMKRQATPDFDWLEDRRGGWLHVFGRLKPGVSSAQAAAGLQPWFKALLESDTRQPGWPVVSPDQRKRYFASTLELLPASSGRSDLRRQLEQPLMVLLAATALVLLLACLNVANLSLARAFARRRDTALRLAIGASRPRVVRELLVESALLAVGGALLGMALAPLVTSGLVSFLPDAVDLSTAVDRRVFVFALLAAVSTGLLFGLMPALQASRTQPAFTLKEDARTVAGGLGLRKALVVGQITLALVLLVGAGLFVRTLRNLRSQGPGFATTNLVSFTVNPARSGYDEPSGRRLLLELLEQVRALPEVQHASISSALLLAGGSWQTGMTIESDHRFTTDRQVHIAAVTPGFFTTLGTKVLAGRDFGERDVRAEDAKEPKFRSVVINERMAQHYFNGKNPLGARIGFGNRPDAKADMEIVGVVKTFSYRGIRQEDDEMFVPLLEGTNKGGVFYVRTRAASSAAFTAIRAAAQRVDPGVPVTYLRTIDTQLDYSLSKERLLAMLATAFAGLAVLLAVVGLYGVTSFVVSRRTREIGIRLALGAPRAGALWMIVRDTALMVGVGVAIAVPVVFSLGRFVQSQLFGVQAMDVATIVAAACLVASVALAAAALPARRAVMVSPIEALRYE